MEKMVIPPYVYLPQDPCCFVPVKDHPETNRSGLGYGILRALGAHPDLSDGAQKIIADWSDTIAEQYGKITPHSANLRSVPFSKRVGPPFCSELAAENAACYPGKPKLRKPSYRDLFIAVWVDQKWPQLCKALAGKVD